MVERLLTICACLYTIKYSTPAFFVFARMHALTCPKIYIQKRYFGSYKPIVHWLVMFSTFLKPRTDDQVFLDKFYLLVCTTAAWSCQLLNKAPCQGKTCQGHSLYCAVIAVKENLFSCPNEQLKLVEKNCWEKTCSSYTRTRKATKELVKENLFVCVGLYTGRFLTSELSLYIYIWNANSQP